MAAGKMESERQRLVSFVGREYRTSTRSGGATDIGDLRMFDRLGRQSVGNDRLLPGAIGRPIERKVLHHAAAASAEVPTYRSHAMGTGIEHFQQSPAFAFEGHSDPLASQRRGDVDAPVTVRRDAVAAVSEPVDRQCQIVVDSGQLSISRHCAGNQLSWSRHGFQMFRRAALLQRRARPSNSVNGVG